MAAGGGRANEIRAGFSPGRRSKHQYQGVGALPWLLERRDGLDRGIYRRPTADGRFSSKQIPPEAQWRLNTLFAAGGYSAHQPIFGPNPIDLCGSGQLARQWKLRTTAQGAALNEIDNNKLRRLLA